MEWPALRRIFMHVQSCVAGALDGERPQPTRYPPGERDAQIRLRGAGEPGAHCDRLPRVGSHDRLHLHVYRPGRVALVYDLMEPLRPRIDRLLLDFVRSHTFTPSDFILEAEGACRLHPQLARRVAQLAASGMAIEGWSST